MFCNSWEGGREEGATCTDEGLTTESSLAELLCMGIDGMGDFQRLHGNLIDRFI